MLSTEHILLWLQSYGYFVFFPIIIVEGPIVTIVAGTLAAKGAFNPWIILMLAVVGDLIGDLWHYWIGYLFTRGRFQKYIAKHGLDEDFLKRFRNWFGKYGGKTLIYGKLTHFFGVQILIAAGISRMSVWAFLWYNFWPTIIKSGLLLLLGYLFGASLSVFEDVIRISTIVTVVLLLLTITTLFFSKRITHKLKDKLEKGGF